MSIGVRFGLRVVVMVGIWIMLLFLMGSSALATLWYVDNQASGDNSGTTWNNAWNNLGSVDFDLINVGDTLFFSGGGSSQVYNGTLVVPPATSNITITKSMEAGHSGEVIFDGGSSTTYGISINATGTAVQNLVVSNLTFDAYTGAGIYGDGQNSGGLQFITIDNCRFLNIRRAGVFFEGNNNPSNNHDLVVKNSYFDDDNTFTSQIDGIYVQVLNDFTADNNYILFDNNYLGVSDLHSDNIQTYLVDNVTYSNNIILQTSDKTLGTQMLFSEGGNGVHTYYNNVFIRNTPNAEDSALRIKSVDPLAFTANIVGNTYYGRGRVMNSSVATVIKNNIIYGISQPITARDLYLTGAGSDVSNNIFYDPNNNFPSATGGVDVDPLFVNADFASIDLRLQSSSPAIGSGLDLGSVYGTDLLGVDRGLIWDIGAYEYIPPTLTVTINQSIGQSDPTNQSTINYTVVFSESVDDFATGDVTLSGTASATNAVVTGSGTTYNVAVSGMSGSGTVSAAISAGKASGVGGTNIASTSTDNTVNYDITPPTLTSFSIGDSSGFTNNTRPTMVTVASDSPIYMAFSCNSGTNWSNWVGYTDITTDFNVTDGAVGCNTTNGSKTITVKLKDLLGNESGTMSDSTYYDNTSPDGGSINYDDGIYTIGAVGLTLADGSDGSGSGVNQNTRIVQRRSAVLSDNVCGIYGSFTSINPEGTYPNVIDYTVQTANCYEYRYLISDYLGNQVIYFSNNVVKVDVPIPPLTLTYSAGVGGTIVGERIQTINYGGGGSEVTAVGDPGNVFLKWSDELTSNPRQEVGVTGDLSITAEFTSSRTLTSISPSTLQEEVASGFISIGGTSPNATSSFTFNVNYYINIGEMAVFFPYGTVVTSANGSNFDFTELLVEDNTTLVQNQLNDVLGAIRLGVPNINLHFSGLVTVSIPIENTYLGQTLTTYFKNEGSSSWNSGVTCVISGGSCTFQTNHATTYTVKKNVIVQNSQTVTNSTSSNSTPHCGDVKPVSIPDLFEIKTNGNMAKLFFTPILNTGSFFISFSTKTKAEEHGAEVTLYREGVQNFTVNMLKPNTVYYFKVRGQNGCMPGDWSNILKVKTGSKKISKWASFYRYNPVTKIINKIFRKTW